VPVGSDERSATVPDVIASEQAGIGSKPVLAPAVSDAVLLEAAAGAATETAETPQLREPRYATLEAYVTGFLCPIIARRQVGQGRGYVWCPEWWRHGEAVARLMALWEAWEFARLDGGPAMSTWWTVHCDGQMAVLMDAENGPFHLCRPDHHTGTPAPLQCDPAPPGWWTTPE